MQTHNAKKLVAKKKKKKKKKKTYIKVGCLGFMAYQPF